MKINLMGLTKQQLQQEMVAIGCKPYNGSQLFKWIYYFGESDFAKMTNLSKSLRIKLAANYQIIPPELNIVKEYTATDGTIKWLIQVSGGSVVETVLIPKGKRYTLCVSSQAGCMLNCSFCQTARQGFGKNLSSAEIIGQVWLAKKKSGKPITNIVMMGMGEPLLNFISLKRALSIIRDEEGYQLPRRRVTVSTSGVIPEIYRLAKECDVTLAISLHAPTDDLRNILVPLNKKYSIAKLLRAVKDFVMISKNDQVTIEYVMLKNINDSTVHAKQLAKILHNVPCKINLIPFNVFTGSGYQSSCGSTIKNFSQILSTLGFVVTLRESRGRDINAACGQLAGIVKDITKRSQRYNNKLNTVIYQQ